MIQDARRPDRGQDLFMVEVTHGLRSPLSLVIGYGADLSRRARGQRLADLAADLTLIIDRARTMVEMVDRILQDVDERRHGGLGTDEDIEGGTPDLVLNGLSHDLRSPLSIIIGYGENMLRRARRQGLNDFVLDLELIVDIGQDMIDLVNDLLNLHHARCGQVVCLEPETFNLSALVQGRLDSVRRLARLNRNAVEFRPDSDLGVVRSDRTKIGRVLANLLHNACKFTKDGEVLLEGRREPSREGDQIILSVADTGQGMGAESVRELVGRLRQTGAVPPLGPGFGLGLAVCKVYCEAMGGRIDVESTPGRGTTFTARLPAELTAGGPIVVEPPPRSTPAPRRTGPNGSHEIVLIVDDDTATCDLMERNLNEEGFQTRSALGGLECLDMARRLQPAAILLDVVMPDLSGWNVLEALKEVPETANIPVIMATMVDEKEHGYNLGASDFLVKPISRERLVAALRTQLRGSVTGRVLVVASDSPVLEERVRWLREDGWDVAAAPNVRGALRRLEGIDCPELILLDLARPGEDDFAFVERIRNDPDWASIPIVVITAMALEAHERRWLTGRVQRLLEKGAYSQEDLLREIRALVA